MVQLRTKEVYTSHWVDLRLYTATTYGVVSNSILNECRYLHMTSGLFKPLELLFLTVIVSGKTCVMCLHQSQLLTKSRTWEGLQTKQLFIHYKYY